MNLVFYFVNTYVGAKMGILSSESQLDHLPVSACLPYCMGMHLNGDYEGRISVVVTLTESRPCPRKIRRLRKAKNVETGENADGRGNHMPESILLFLQLRVQEEESMYFGSGPEM